MGGVQAGMDAASAPREREEKFLEFQNFLNRLQYGLGSSKSFRLLFGDGGATSAAGNGFTTELRKHLNEELAGVFVSQQQAGGGARALAASGTNAFTPAMLAQFSATSGIQAEYMEQLTALANIFFAPSTSLTAATGGRADSADETAAAMCVLLIDAVYREYDVSAGWSDLDVVCAAAGVFVSERLAAVTSLRMLLVAAITHKMKAAVAGDHMEDIEHTDAYDDTIYNGVISLLSDAGSGGQLVLSTLLSYVKETLSASAAAAAAGRADELWGWSAQGKVTYATVETGNEPLDYLQRGEMTKVCECVAMALPLLTLSSSAERVGGEPSVISNAIGNAVALAELLPILDAMDSRTREVSATAYEAHAQQTYLVTMALVSSMLGPANADKASFRTQVIGDGTLSKLLADGESASVTGAETAHHRFGPNGTVAAKAELRAFVELAYGVFISHDGQTILRAISRGALEYPLKSIFGSNTFEDEDNALKLVVVHVIHELLMSFLNLRVGREAVQKMQAGVDPGAPNRHGEHALPPQCLSHLLETMAAVYTAFPDLCSGTTSNIDILAPFIEHILEFSTASAAVMIPFLHLLRSMSKSENGKLIVLDVMKGDLRAGTVNWDLLFATLSEYCVRFSSSSEVVQADSHPFTSPSTAQMDMSPDDADGLTAFLGLLEAVWEESLASEVEQWASRLRERPEYGYHPLEPLFQLVMHPVPLQLKAALISAIKAFVHSSDSARFVWEKLDICGFVGPPRLSSVSTSYYGDRREESYSGFVTDSGFELREIEARGEQYPRTHAFVKLLNKLLRRTEAADGTLNACGKYTAFVRDEVFYPFASRGYKDEREKWHIAHSCLEHFYCTFVALDKQMAVVNGPWSNGENLSQALRTLRGISGRIQTQTTKRFDNGAGIDASDIGMDANEEIVEPGILVLADFMQDGRIRQTLFKILERGVSHLCDLRNNTKHGAEAEQAIIMAFRLLHIALKTDQLIFESMSSEKAASFPHVEDAFVRDRRHLATIVEYIRYPFNSALQHAVLELLEILLPRLDDPLDLLLQSGQSMGRIMEGMAMCVRQGFYNDSADEGISSDAGSVEDSGESTSQNVHQNCGSSLLLKILIASDGRHPAPGLMHLAMGYDIEYGFEGIIQSHLDVRRKVTCLRPILDGLVSPILLDTQPELYELYLRMVNILASDPHSGPPMLDLLHRELLSPFLEEILPRILYVPLTEFGELDRATSTFIVAHSLQLLALVMHAADADVSLHLENMTLIIQSLFGMQGSGHRVDGDASLIRHALESACYDLHEPSDAQLSDEARRWKQVLLDDDRVSKRLPQLSYESPMGSFHLVDTKALSAAVGAALQEIIASSRMAIPTSDSNDPHAALKEAAAHIVRVAGLQNAFAHADAAQVALLSGWRAVVIVCCTTRFELLTNLAMVSDQSMVLMDLLDASLTRVASLPTSRAEALSPHLCQVIATLLAKLREVSMPGASGRIRSQIPKNGRTIISKLLKALLAPERTGKTRQLLYAGLLSLVHMSTLPLDLELPADVVDVVVNGRPGGIADETMYDAQNSLKSAVEQTVVKAVGPLIAVITRDASEGSQATRTIAFHVIAALVHSGTSFSRSRLLDAAEGSDLIKLCLEEVRRSGMTVMDANSRYSLLALNAALVFILNTCTSDPERIEGLVRVDVLSAITACRAFSMRVADHGNPSANQSEHRKTITIPILRILHAIVTTLPRSTNVVGHMVAFLEHHKTYIYRLLSESQQPVSNESMQQLSVLVGLVTQVMISEKLNEMTIKNREHHSSYLGFTPLLYNLMWRTFSSDRDPHSSHMIRQIEEGRQLHGHDSLEVLAMEISLSEVQAHLLRHLRNADFATAPGLPILSCQSRSPEGELPSLQLLAELVDASRKKLEMLWEHRRQLLENIRDIDRGQVGSFGTPQAVTAPPAAATLHRLSHQIGLLERRENLIIFIIENSLEITHISLKLLVSSTEDGSMVNGPIVPQGNMSPFTPKSRHRVGISSSSVHSQDIDRYTKRLKPVLDGLHSLSADVDNKSMEYTMLVSRHISRLLPEE